MTIHKPTEPVNSFPKESFDHTETQQTRHPVMLSHGTRNTLDNASRTLRSRRTRRRQRRNRPRTNPVGTTSRHQPRRRTRPSHHPWSQRRPTTTRTPSSRSARKHRRLHTNLRTTGLLLRRRRDSTGRSGRTQPAGTGTSISSRHHRTTTGPPDGTEPRTFFAPRWGTSRG